MSHPNLSKLVNVKKLSDGWQAQCPICAREGRDLNGKNHLRLYKSGAYNCAVNHGDPIHNSAIKAFLCGGGTQPEIEYIDQYEEPKIDKVYPDSVLERIVPDYSYWIGRGMNPEVLKALECGLAPADEKGPLSGRSVFPLRNPRGQISAFTGRLVIENSIGKKWIHLSPVSKVVWPWKLSGPEIERTKTAVLIESPGDTVACLSHGIKPVVCLFGLNLFSLTIGALVGAGVNRVFVSLNRDKDASKGQAAAERIKRKLESFVSDVRIRLPNEPWNDWGECAEGGEAGAAELARFREEIG